MLFLCVFESGPTPPFRTGNVCPARSVSCRLTFGYWSIRSTSFGLRYFIYYIYIYFFVVRLLLYIVDVVVDKSISKGEKEKKPMWSNKVNAHPTYIYMYIKDKWLLSVEQLEQ